MLEFKLGHVSKRSPRSNFCIRIFSSKITSQLVRGAIITSLLRQNDVATPFWRNNHVIITACVNWDENSHSRGKVEIAYRLLWFAVTWPECNGWENIASSSTINNINSLQHWYFSSTRTFLYEDHLSRQVLINSHPKAKRPESVLFPRACYFYNGNPHSNDMTSLYWVSQSNLFGRILSWALYWQY